MATTRVLLVDDESLVRQVLKQILAKFSDIEVVGEAASEAQWQYSLARMSSHKLAVHLEGREIWQVGNYWQDRTGDRKTGPYVEAKDGIFSPAADAP